MINAPTAPNAEYVDVLADSRLWKHFRPRADDIIIVTPPKSGTTWTQAIVALLLSGDPGFNASPSINSPWIDAAGDDIDEVFGQLEAQTQRRYIKTHALGWHPRLARVDLHLRLPASRRRLLFVAQARDEYDL